MHGSEIGRHEQCGQTNAVTGSWLFLRLTASLVTCYIWDSEDAAETLLIKCKSAVDGTRAL